MDTDAWAAKMSETITGSGWHRKARFADPAQS
jgi:hypothetical protein